jgi:hypothetical protein
LGSGLVLEIAPGDDRRAVAFRDINRVLGVGYLDPWAAARRSRMTSRDRVGIVMMNGRLMGSGHCSPFQP